MNFIRQTAAFTARNIKLFFKDKGTFITSLISPLVLLVLYILFLDGVLKDSMTAVLDEMGGLKLAAGTMNGFVASFEVSSLIAVSGVTVAFIANMAMVDDRITGARNDLMIAPVKKSVLTLGYYFATAIVTLIICFAALAAGLIYIAASGWAMSAGDCFLAILDTVLCVLFGTALSSIVCFFLKSRGAISAVSTIVSFIYGFICGAYYPISQFAPSMQNIVMCLPGTYCTGLLRTHFMSGYLDKFIAGGLIPEQASGLFESMDGKLNFFGGEVPTWAMYLVVLGAIVALVGIFVLNNLIHVKRR
ncbi:MAG: ABC transporter permease, partial [Clostridiales bacterium]|nr:ABC transporter permease [Clostridiales bacterium]